LTYDVTDENSFKNIRNWVRQIEQNAQSNVCKVLIGNKSDREDRKVSYEEGTKLAKEYNMQFFETSAKSNYNVNETFTFLTKEILNTCEVKPAPGGMKIDDSKNKFEKGDKQKCCK
jgi:Ras-related protein Rab-8A